MRILYIHGLDSRPNPERISSLEAVGHEVIAPDIDYRTQPQTYNRLRGLVRENEISFIVGSSLGGLMGYWLSHDLGLPCLLFNPAIYVSREEANIVLEEQKGCTERWVVIGDEDDVVNPDESWAILREERHTAQTQFVIRQQGLGHQIDRDTFVAAQRWAGLG